MVKMSLKVVEVSEILEGVIWLTAHSSYSLKDFNCLHSGVLVCVHMHVRSEGKGSHRSSGEIHLSFFSMIHFVL